MAAWHQTRLENLRGHLAAAERALAETDDAERRATLEDDARRLRVAIAEVEGRSLTGAGWKRP